jgi:hypothetical protein
VGLTTLLLLLAAASEPSGRVELSPRLAAWKSEIEARGQRIILARVYPDVPQDTDQRAAVARVLADPAYAAQLRNAHAMTVNLEGYGRRASFILLNMARYSEWRAFEEPLIAHEFGHVYLHVRGYRSPGIAPGEPVCEATHVGDMVQHILIRQEMKKRGIDYVPWMAGTLDPVIAILRKGGPAPNGRCDQLARLSMWVDASLGLTERDWPRLPEFLELMQQRFPELAPVEASLRDQLAALDVTRIPTYESALRLAQQAASQTSSR